MLPLKICIVQFSAVFTAVVSLKSTLFLIIGEGKLIARQSKRPTCKATKHHKMLTNFLAKRGASNEGHRERGYSEANEAY